MHVPRALIVYAHPEPASFNHALMEAAKARFEASGWEVEVSDLYGQRFDPVASRADFVALASPERFSLVHEQRHAQPVRGYSADILAEQDKVARADVILFQFPLWWYSAPAILKGWIERVFGNGFAYGDEAMFEQGLLAGKRAMLSITTGGSRAELDADRGFTGSVEEFLRPLGGGVLAFTGLTVLDPFVAYAVGAMNWAERGDALRALESRVDGIVATHASTLPIGPGLKLYR
jgi:putative NADPH-quinone reductase